MKNMFKRSRKLVIGLLIMLSVMTSGLTYAYWASNITGNNANSTGTVNVGTGQLVTTTVNVTAQTNGAELVPAGTATGSQVTSVVLTFPVTWTGDPAANGALGTLTVTTTSITVGGVSNPFGLVQANYTTTHAIVANGDTVNVVVTITLNMPANQTQYAAVASKEIILTLNFSVVPNVA